MKKNEGITLIALVITIVLLILAGVSIATLTGENGILTQATKAAEETKKASEEEQRKLAMMEATASTENTTYEGVTIPAGFAPTRIEGENNVKEGLVITDSKGNEFVWIPVPDITQMANKIAGREEQKDANGNEYYQGKLYDFNSISDITEKKDYGQGTNGYREPAYLSSTSYDGNKNYNKSLFTEASLQEDYNSMIASVNKYKGFYVGRYEMSKEFASKKGETSAKAEDTETSMWYGLYSKAKSFYSKEDSNISVVGSMIWGSQYDRMMIWMKDNGINVTSTEPIEGATRNTNLETGKEEKDKLNNIYDLLGNMREWTLEANDSNTRIERGGSYLNSASPSYRPSFDPPYYTNPNDGSRLTLYIK